MNWMYSIHCVHSVVIKQESTTETKVSFSKETDNKVTKTQTETDSRTLNNQVRIKHELKRNQKSSPFNILINWIVINNYNKKIHNLENKTDSSYETTSLFVAKIIIVSKKKKLKATGTTTKQKYINILSINE